MNDSQNGSNEADAKVFGPKEAELRQKLRRAVGVFEAPAGPRSLTDTEQIALVNLLASQDGEDLVKAVRHERHLAGNPQY